MFDYQRFYADMLLRVSDTSCAPDTHSPAGELTPEPPAPPAPLKPATGRETVTANFDLIGEQQRLIAEQQQLLREQTKLIAEKTRLLDENLKRLANKSAGASKNSAPLPL